MTDPVVIDRVNKKYGDAVTALSDVSFRVAPGEILGILGPNGSGKTTMLRILMALTQPTSGHAYVLGNDVSGDPMRVRREVGYAPQGSAFEDFASPKDSLMLLAQLYRVPGSERAARVDELLEKFGLAQDADRPLRQLSGGMRRRLDLAAALIHQPRVLILDEPTVAVDPAARDELWQLVTELVATRGIPVMFTTHLLEEADRFSNRVVIIDRGKLVAEGAPEALKAALGGETVSVRVNQEPPADTVARLQAQICGAGAIQITGRTIHVGATNAREQLWHILDCINGLGFGIEATEINRPSLNDVYLRATGRTYEVQGDTPAESARSAAQFWRRGAKA